MPGLPCLNRREANWKLIQCQYVYRKGTRWDGMGWGLLNSSSPPRNISTSLSLLFLFSALTLVARHLWWWWVNHDGGIRDVWVALLRPNVPVLGHWGIASYLHTDTPWNPIHLIRLVVSCFPFHTQLIPQLGKPRPQFRVKKLFS